MSAIAMHTHKRKTGDEQFVFGIPLIDNSVVSVREHTISSYKQITAVCILDLAYVLAYGGLLGTEHYVFDASSSATGKDSAADRSYQLHLQPVMQLQSDRKEAYEYERQSSDTKLPSKSFHCIHTTDATPQGTYLGFETTKTQYPRMGEIGNKMRNKEHPLMIFITDSYGKHTLVQPNYKKDLEAKGDLTVDEISLFFYGNSNIQMMGEKIFIYHLQGGLLNRCILIYNTEVRAFDERPHDFDLPHPFVMEVNTKIRELIDFAKKHAGMAKPKIPRTEAYRAFDKYIFEQTNEVNNTGIQDLFKRTMQNLNAIIYTLHYLICAQEDSWQTEIAESTVLMGVKYMRYIIDGYDMLISEIIGSAQDERDESIRGKIHKKVQELTIGGATKIVHRDIYRPLHLKVDHYKALIAKMNYQQDANHLIPLTVTA